MKKIFFTIPLLFIVCFLSAQGIAPLVVKVTNFKAEVQQGETIIFVGQKSKKIIKGTTNEKGIFKVDVPAGDIYDIKIASVGDDQDYTSYEIPALPKGQYYQESELLIKFEPARLFTLNNVFFDTGKSTLKQSSYQELNELVEAMKAKPNMKIEIAGHTDDVGEEEANKLLSEQRAISVKKYLESKGIENSRILAVGYGETQPIAENSTPEGRAKNRRTEVRVISY